MLTTETSIMDLLAAGVPVTLLMDLGANTPLPSRDIYAQEGGDAGWLAATG